MGEQVYVTLEPKELIDKHFWLFASHWVDDSADEVEDYQNMNFEEREEIIRQKRVIALKEILQEKRTFRNSRIIFKRRLRKYDRFSSKTFCIFIR